MGTKNKCLKEIKTLKNDSNDKLNKNKLKKYHIWKQLSEMCKMKYKNIFFKEIILFY